MARCAEGVWPGEACPELVEGTLYNRWKRWSDKGIFIRMMEGLATPQAPERKTITIDTTYLKAHRTASSLGVKRESRTPDWPDERRHEHRAVGERSSTFMP